MEAPFAKLNINVVLHTRDGRVTGNAIVVGHQQVGTDFYHVVKTDYGNICKLTWSELSGSFYISEVALPDHKHFVAENPPGTYDMVNQPPHYKTESGIEAIDVIEAFGLGFDLGNTVKYILRAGKKKSADKAAIAKEVEDLQKAEWYLKRRISNLKK